jgi:hypothetical protein
MADEATHGPVTVVEAICQIVKEVDARMSHLLRDEHELLAALVGFRQVLVLRQGAFGREPLAPGTFSMITAGKGKADVSLECVAALQRTQRNI